MKKIWISVWYLFQLRRQFFLDKFYVICLLPRFVRRYIDAKEYLENQTLEREKEEYDGGQEWEKRGKEDESSQNSRNVNGLYDYGHVYLGTVRKMS